MAEQQYTARTKRNYFAKYTDFKSFLLKALNVKLI